MTSLERVRLAGDERAPNLEKLVHEIVAAIMVEIDAVAGKLDRVTATDDIDDQPPIRHPVERRSHPRCGTWSDKTRPHRDDEPELFGKSEQHGRDDPGFFGIASGGNKDSSVIELIDSLRDLPQVVERGYPGADLHTQMARIL